MHIWEHKLQKDFPPARAFLKYDITVADSPVLQRYLDVKYNGKQWELCTLGRGGYFLSVTGEHCLRSVIGSINNVFNEWSWETINNSLYHAWHCFHLPGIIIGK